MTKLYFLRHGQSQANLDGVHATPESPLTDLGRHQALAAAQKVAVLNIATIISSDLPRALETAEILAQSLGLSKAQVIHEPRLREVGVGNLAGTPDHNIAAYLAHQADPQGDTTVESLAAATSRLKSFIISFKDYHDGNVLLVGHSGSGRLLRALLSGDTGNIANSPNLTNAEPFELPVNQGNGR
ncbi:MAG TPA: histidine phosphatase family protein [Candidatus Saccharimonadia bacterium]|jgi:probable phosphoglycerate mutase